MGELIDTLPFDIKQYNLTKFRHKEEDYLRQVDESAKRRKEEIKLFFRLINAGLVLGAGLVVVKQYNQVSYMVTGMDFVNFEITAVRYDLETEDRYRKIRSDIELSRIDGVIGHMETLMINA